MPSFLVDFDVEPPEVWVPPTPEVIVVPADLPTLNPAVTIRLPLSEEITDIVLVPGEHEGGDVLYVAVTQERVNVWAAMVYFAPEIAIGLSTLLLLVALRKVWTWRRFTHKPGEAYCKKCWAGLTGVQSDTCPECGKAVKKVKRTAKGKHLGLTWVCCTAAVAAIIITAGVWFIESWDHLWHRGFDYQSADDWWTLIDPLDHDSALRLNNAAYLFDWKSTKLAAFARERDQAWINKVISEYEEDAIGGDYPLLIRRYRVTDGELLGEYPLPNNSSRQYEDFRYAGHIHNVNGILLFDDDLNFFRLRPEHLEPWLQFGEESKGDNEFDAAVSSDGKFLFFTETYNRDRQDLVSPSVRQRLIQMQVVDIDTGQIKFKVIFSPEEREYNTPPRITRYFDESPPIAIIHDSFRGMIPSNTDGQLLLPLADNLFSDSSIHYVRCDFRLKQFEEVEIDASEQVDLRYDCTLEGYRQGRVQAEFQNEIDAEYNAYEIASARQRNIQWATSDSLIGGRNLAGMLGPFFPGKIYNPYRDFLLYDLDQGVVPVQPTRVLTIQPPQASTIFYSWVSSRDCWLVVQYDQRPSILLHRETAKPIAWIPTQIRMYDSNCQFYRFANDDQQIIAIHHYPPTPTPQHTFFDRHEILIFDLPDVDE